MTITRRALVGTQRRFHRHDIHRNGALPGIDRKHEAAAGDAAVDLDHQPPTDSELTIDTSARSIPDAADEIERMLAETGILFDELVDLAANI